MDKPNVHLFHCYAEPLFCNCEICQDCNQFCGVYSDRIQIVFSALLLNFKHIKTRMVMPVDITYMTSYEFLKQINRHHEQITTTTESYIYQMYHYPKDCFVRVYSMIFHIRAYALKHVSLNQANQTIFVHPRKKTKCWRDGNKNKEKYFYHTFSRTNWCCNHKIVLLIFTHISNIPEFYD